MWYYANIVLKTNLRVGRINSLQRIAKPTFVGWHLDRGGGLCYALRAVLTAVALIERTMVTTPLPSLRECHAACGVCKHRNLFATVTASAVCEAISFSQHGDCFGGSAPPRNDNKRQVSEQRSVRSNPLKGTFSSPRLGDCFAKGARNDSLSSYLPILNAFQPRCGSSGGFDAFVTKLNPTGTALVYSSYLGGSADDKAYAIAIDSSGAAYLTGETNSSDFPIRAGAYPTYGGNTDAFVSKVAADGSSLVYSTYLGGINSQDISYGIAVNAQGEAYVTGKTNGFNNNDFPTTSNAYQMTFAAFQDLFMTKLDAAGSTPLYSTLLSGHDQVIAQAVAVDANGMAYVTGWTNYACNFPTTAGAYQSPPQTCTLADTVFALKFNPAASGSASLVYSTLVGNSGSGRGHGIAVDGTGAAYLTGTTSVPNFPTTEGGAYDTTFNGGTDLFVTKLNATGSGLLYASYFGGSGYEGGSGDETPSGIAIGAANAVYLTGYTTSFDLPTSSNAVQPTLNYNGYCCNQDAFVTMLTLPWPTSFTYNLNVPEECTCWVAAPNGTVGKPINTRTGAQDYTSIDLSFPALGKTMMFQRAYSSLATDLYTTTLGFGWTHNLDTRLILPTSPGGVAGQIRFKPHSANQLIFFSGNDGTYTQNFLTGQPQNYLDQSD